MADCNCIGVVLGYMTEDEYEEQHSRCCGSYRPAMMLDSLDIERHKHALTVSMEHSELRVSRRSRCDWTSCTICSQEEYKRDRRLYGWQIEFPALGALRLHRKVFRRVGDVPLLGCPVSASQRELLSRELIAIKYIARRWWRINIRRIRETNRYAISETLWQMRNVQRSLERNEADEGWRPTDGEWSQVLRPLLIAKEDITMTGGIAHLLCIFDICLSRDAQMARRMIRARDGKGRRTPEKRQCVIDYLIEHPQCETKEIMEACRVSKGYVYQIKRMLKG